MNGLAYRQCLGNAFIHCDGLTKKTLVPGISPYSSGHPSLASKNSNLPDLPRKAPRVSEICRLDLSLVSSSRATAALL